ncbi:MAG: thiamine-binding protein [Reichenbachiella sp.]
MNFAIFPVDKGDHISEYVSKVINYIKDSGMTYQFTPMGTIVEGETVAEVLKIVEKSYEILDPISNRVYCVMNMDYKKNKSNLIKSKTESVEKRIGKVNK